MRYFGISEKSDTVSRAFASEDCLAIAESPLGFARVLRDSPPGPVWCSTWRAVPTVVVPLVERANAGHDVRVVLDGGATRRNDAMRIALRSALKDHLLETRSHAKLLLFEDRVVLTSANGGEVVGHGRDEWWYSSGHQGDLDRVRELFLGGSQPEKVSPPSCLRKFSRLQSGAEVRHGDGGTVTVTPPGYSPLSTLVGLMGGSDLTLAWWRPTVGFAKVMRACADAGLVGRLTFVLDDASATRVSKDQGGRSRGEGLEAIRELLPDAEVILVRAPRTVHLKTAAFGNGRVLLSTANWQETGPSSEAYVYLEDSRTAELVQTYVDLRRETDGEEAPF